MKNKSANRLKVCYAKCCFNQLCYESKNASLNNICFSVVLVSLWFAL